MTTRLGRVAGCLALALATARCADKILAPVANAGTAVTVNMGSSVALDGRSSSDPQGRSLAYDWSITGRPALSQTSLNDAHIATPSFVPDLDGTYTIELVVSNGVLSSPPSKVTVTARKCSEAAPEITAVAAAPANPNTGTSVQLSATIHDADNDPACNLNQTFTLLWTAVTRPGASTAVLSDPTATSPTFVPDEIGPYQFSVVATDSTGLQSAPKFVTFTTSPCGAAAVTFAAPAITAAFAETAANVGAAVTLTAHPVDPAVACGVPAGPVQYVWTLAGPSGSSAVAFAVQAGAQFTFTPDVVGTYDISVHAVDARGQSASASTSVSTTTCGAAPIVVQVTPAASSVNSYEPLTLTATPAATTCPARFAPVIAWAVAGGGASAQLSASFGGTVDFRGTGAGDYTVSAVAINTSGHEGPVGSASVHVNACGSRPPVVVTTSNSPTFPARRQTVTLAATAVDPDAACGDARTSTIGFELLSLPQGSGISFAAGANSFQPDVEGTYAFRVVATEDGTGLRSDAAVLNVNVLDPDPAASSVTAAPTGGGGFVVADGVDSATVTVTLRNRLGQPVAALPVSVAASGTANTFSPPTGNSNVNGIFVTTLTSTKAETKTITAVANSPLAPVVLNDHPSVSFVAGPTASIVLTGLPSSVTAGVPSTVTVTAFDAFANVAKGPNAYTGTISFTADDPHPAALPPDFTFTAGDDGTHTFTNGVTLFKAGLRKVTVSDAAHGFSSFQTTTVTPAAAATFTVVVNTDPVTAGTASSFTVTAFDQFDNVATGYRGTATFTSSDAQATFAPTSRTFTAGDAGLFVGSVTLKTAGLQTVTATDSVNHVTGTSAAVTVKPAAPATAVFSVQPSSATAGVHIAPAVEVTVSDAFTNLVPGASVTLSIGVNAGGGTLSGTTTRSTNASGVASFADLSIEKAGVGYTLHATVPSSPSAITADSAAFDISAAAPATAAFTVQPTTTTAGLHITPAVEVTVRDAFANLVPGASVTVSIGTNPASGVLSGTLTRSTSVAGVATFADLSIDKAGTGYTLHAVVPSTPSPVTADSTAFDITAAAPATAAFTVQPSTTTAGVHITPALEVTVKDAFANLVPGASVTVSIGTNPASGTLSGTLTRSTSASGVASFADLSIDKAGTGYKLHAAVTGTPGDDSTAFDITPAAPATAVFSVQPTITTTGLHITPAVEITVKDAFANLVPGASVTVSIGTNPTGGTLSGTTTGTTNASGVASFADLSINKAGTGYKLHAAVTGTPGDDSTAFDVVDPAVITTFIAAPTSIFSGGATQLSYVFSGGTGSIDPGGHPATSPGATVVTNVATTTTFTLNVTNAAGTVTSASATATVTSPTAWVDLNNPTLTPPDTRAAQPFSMAFDPADPSTIYAATLASGVLTTSNGGALWTATGFPAGVPAQSVAVGHPGGNLSLWASADQAGQLYHSTDALNWTPVTGNGLPAVATVQRTAIRLDPSDPLQQTLYVTFSEGGLFRSVNDGSTWTKIDLTLPDTTVDDQATALAVASNGAVFVGTASGNVFHFSGTTVTQLTTSDTNQVNAIAVDPDGNTVVVGYSDGLVEFATGPGFALTTGDTLAGMLAGLAFAVDGTASGGMITGSIYAVTANAGAGAVFRSTNSGATFTNVTTATPPIDASDYFFVAPHPTDGTTIYVLGNGSLAVPPATLPSSGFFRRTFGNPAP